MNVAKFDRDRYLAAIDIFKESNNRPPYIICGQETYEAIKNNFQNEIYLVTPSNIMLRNGEPTVKPQKHTITVDGIEYVPKEDRFLTMWRGSKIIVDPDLKYGEIYLG